MTCQDDKLLIKFEALGILSEVLSGSNILKHETNIGQSTLGRGKRSFVSMKSTRKAHEEIKQ